MTSARPRWISPIPTCAPRSSCWCAATKAASADPASFKADEKLLIGAQAGTSPFYVAVYNVLDGNEQNPRIKLFETFAASVAALQSGDVDLVLTDSAAGKARSATFRTAS